MSEGHVTEYLVGLIRVRSHCTFTWRKWPHQDQRSVEVRPSHCPECVDEIRRRGYALKFSTTEEPN